MIFDIIPQNLFSISSTAAERKDPPSFIKPLKPQVITDGNDIKLSCRVAGSPDLVIEWFKDEKKIVSNRRAKLHFHDGLCTLVIKKSTLDDQGIYRCTVSNKYGSVKSSANLEIQRKTIKPRVTKWLNNLVITKGEEAKFFVNITGYEKPKIEWYHGLNKLWDGGRHKMSEAGEDQYILTISDVTEKDYGTYQVIATNSAGKAFSQAILQVLEKQISPAFEQRDVQDTLVFREGDEINLVMTIRGYPQPMVTWYKDGKPLYGFGAVSIQSRGDSYFLVINKASVDHSGTYKCEARNKHGVSFRTFDIKVEGMTEILIFMLHSASLEISFGTIRKQVFASLALLTHNCFIFLCVLLTQKGNSCSTMLSPASDLRFSILNHKESFITGCDVSQSLLLSIFYFTFHSLSLSFLFCFAWPL